MVIGISVLGLSCILISNLILFPQLYRILKNKHARDVSLGTLVLGAIAQVLWAVYGYQIGDKPLWMSSAIALIIAVVVLGAYMRYRE